MRCSQKEILGAVPKYVGVHVYRKILGSLEHGANFGMMNINKGLNFERHIKRSREREK